jgi:multidrug efflux system outer membrane protein
MKSFLSILLVLATAALPAPGAELPVSAAATDWWTAFAHPGLTAAIEQGLAAHPDTASALARIRAADAGVDLARAARRPEVGVQAGYRGGREQSVKTAGIEDDIDPLFGSARLAWELDVFGKAGAGIDAATARSGQSEADLAAIRLLLSLEIARAYVDVAHLNEQAKWNAEEVEDTRTIFERERRRADAGLEPDTARSLARAAWQQAEHRLMQTEIERDRARARLKSLVGGTSPAGEPASLSGFRLPPQPQLENGERLLGRPDVVKAHLAWLQARGEAKASSRARLPSLAFVVSAAGEGEQAGDPESWSAWAGPVVSLPLWNPGLKAQSARARAAEEASAADLQAISLRAVEEIDRAWAERARSESMIEHMRARHEALASVAGTETRKRAAGLAQEDAVRQARLNAAQAARAELDWRAAALHAHLTLIAALGGG